MEEGRSRQSEEGLYGRFLRPLTVTPSLSHGERSNSAIALESESVCHDCRPAVHVLRSVNMRPVPANMKTEEKKMVSRGQRYG